MNEGRAKERKKKPPPNLCGGVCGGRGRVARFLSLVSSCRRRVPHPATASYLRSVTCWYVVLGLPRAVACVLARESSSGYGALRESQQLAGPKSTLSVHPSGGSSHGSPMVFTMNVWFLWGAVEREVEPPCVVMWACDGMSVCAWEGGGGWGLGDVLVFVPHGRIPPLHPIVLAALPFR
jgi:hypothetical protein